MTPEELLLYLRAQPLAVESSVSSSGAPQAAIVGVAVTDRFELVFDTVATSRKHQNLARDPRIALVIGWDQERTVQLQGVADQPRGHDLSRVQSAYFARFPDGPSRLSWPGIAYWRVRPEWIRYSDFNTNPPTILEWDRATICGWSAQNVTGH